MAFVFLYMLHVSKNIQ